GRIMLAGNYIGPDRPVARDTETLGVVFDAIARTADAHEVPAGTTVQWDFTDAEPWHLVLENGATRAQPGAAPKADVTLRMELAAAGRARAAEQPRQQRVVGAQQSPPAGVAALEDVLRQPRQLAAALRRDERVADLSVGGSPAGGAVDARGGGRSAVERVDEE